MYADKGFYSCLEEGEVVAEGVDVEFECRMEEKLIYFLSSYFQVFRMSKRFAIGSINSLTKLQCVVLLGYFNLCVEHEITPTREELIKAIDLIKIRTKE